MSPYPESSAVAPADGAAGDIAKTIHLSEHTVEIVSDSGEGAQKCGQLFASVSAKMGNGVWTVEIIPAEIQPPPRTLTSGSGNRIRIGSGPVTNWGDESNLVAAFNEQVLLSRHRLGALAEDAIILIEDYWSHHDDEKIRGEWEAAMEELSHRSYRIIPVPMEEQCLTVVVNVGGDLYAIGESEDGDPWKVGIRSAADPSKIARTLEIADQAVATSGDYLQFFRYRDRRYHHLLDPVTGAPRVSSAHSVTVTAHSCMTADAAATAVFGMVRSRAEGLVRASGARVVHSA